MLFFRLLLALLRALVQDRSQLLLQIPALRHQLLVFQRSMKRPQPRQADRIFWILLTKLWKDWRPNLVLVRPETVVAWHRRAFNLFWLWKSRPR
jgi:putative transposase